MPAIPQDWSVDPFKLTEKDGYFYARGSGDDKYMAASFVTNLIRYKQEGYKPDRDIIVALETDEEILDRDALGIQWLIKNHRDLIDAEFALNEGGGVGLKDGKPIRNSVQTSEKVSLTYQLDVKNRGGHSAVPLKDNAIYRLAEGLMRLSKFTFPLQLNDTTRALLRARRRNSRARRPRPTCARCCLTNLTRPRCRLSGLPPIRSITRMLRTTCVATMLEAGQAVNALPQLASAKVNCRIMPGESIDEVKATWSACWPTTRSRLPSSVSRYLSAPSALQRGDLGCDRETVAANSGPARSCCRS